MILSSAWALAAVARPVILVMLAQSLAAAGPAPRSRVAPNDSLRLLHRARGAQSDFEVVRRGNLPNEGSGNGGHCDAVIGRFCYWTDDGDDSPPPPEPARIVRARDRLLSVLDSIAALIPGDAWVAGQRVRYRADAGRPADALEAARACRASPSWCAALVGYALHADGRYAAADSAFDAALAAMPDAERCRWTDLVLLLDDDLADRYRALDCAHRDSLAERVWWLSTPLYLIGTHDLRTEELARVTRTRMEEHARPTQESWGDDVRELILRYGWPTWFTRQLPPIGSMLEPVIAGHDPSPSFSFLPRAAAVDSPFTAGPQSWDLRLRSARVRYAPPYVKSIHELPAQLAVFRRGDSALVVGAFDAGGDTTLAGRALDAGLFLWSDARHASQTTRDSVGTTAVLTATAPWRPLVAGLEVLARADRRAARTRVGISPRPAAGAVTLSDLLLYNPRDSTPRRLADALPLAAVSTTVSRARPLGLFWETYGLPARGSALRVSLTIVRIGEGWFRRAAETLRLAGHDAPLSVEWQEIPGADDGIAARAIAVDLSHLAGGRYRITLTVAPPNQAPIVVQREIVVR